MNRAVLAAAALAALPDTSLAQPLPPGAERARDRGELRQDRRELADDRRDAFFGEALLARFDDARARRSRRAVMAVEADVLRELDRELKEARREVRRSAREVREERREVRADAGHGGRHGEWDDRRDLRDDRRDLRDDRRDLARVRAVRDEFAALRGRMDRRGLDQKRALVVELVRMARAELAEDRVERREDRRELREDRRERWEHGRGW